MKEVDARIKYANDFYEGQVLQELRLNTARQEERRRVDEALMDEARRQAKNL